MKWNNFRLIEGDSEKAKIKDIVLPKIKFLGAQNSSRNPYTRLDGNQSAVELQGRLVYSRSKKEYTFDSSEDWKLSETVKKLDDWNNKKFYSTENPQIAIVPLTVAEKKELDEALINPEFGASLLLGILRERLRYSEKHSKKHSGLLVDPHLTLVQREILAECSLLRQSRKIIKHKEKLKKSYMKNEAITKNLQEARSTEALFNVVKKNSNPSRKHSLRRNSTRRNTLLKAFTLVLQQQSLFLPCTLR
eukprot:TRINITY_DN34608_c0_g1_i2.p1 TRINITY_DN34608_c0_g1~~TRINITY_DN34608_c0_g1_i2.p1  ORF type:complete len:248 (-),score=37.31 TRINITY_DN34608_c0_g1_i2:4-747(-)